MFNVYTVELLDTKDHVYLEYAILAVNITSAIEQAKISAYKIIDGHAIVIRYVSVKDDNEQYMYNMLTKTLHKCIKEY